MLDNGSYHMPELHNRSDRTLVCNAQVLDEDFDHMREDDNVVELCGRTYHLAPVDFDDVH